MPDREERPEQLFAPIPGPMRPDPEFEALERSFRLQAQRRARMWVGASLLLCLSLLTWSHGDRVMQQGRRAWFWWQAMASDAPLAGVDLERVHAELLTDWVIARSRDADGGEQAYHALRDALAASPALTQLFHSIHDMAAPDDGLWQRHRALLDAVEDWNELLQRHDVPWWLEGNVVASADVAQFYIKSYRVKGRTVVKVGAERVVVRLLSRADKLNVLEVAMGHASAEREQAVVLLHRVEAHARDTVWPALAVNDETSPLSRHLREELKLVLDRRHWQTLTNTGAWRRQIKDVMDRVHGRHRCGARLVLRMKQLSGFEPETLRWLRSVAERESKFECAAITSAEVETLTEASEALRRAEDLPEAVAQLVAFLSRGVAVHEAKHVADQRARRGLEEPLPCAVCTRKHSVRTRAELSAWTAELGWGAAPYATLLHACRAPRTGATGKALGLLLAGLGEEVCHDPPADLRSRARDFERRVFGRSEPVQVLSPALRRPGDRVLGS